MKRTLSEINRANAAKRKRYGGPPKKLEPCSHCGQFLGVRERRAHGDRRKGGSLGPPVQKIDTEK